MVVDDGIVDDDGIDDDIVDDDDVGMVVLVVVVGV